METDLPGRRLGGRYLVHARLAGGGMAEVWEARDEVLGRRVALKILHGELSRNEDLLERFRLEAIAAARLSHPAIVRVFDTGVDEGTCYIVMELLEGATLAEAIEREAPLAPVQAASIARQVLDGLTHAHGAGIVHRDIKPTNILLDPAGRVLVADFGIAKAAFGSGDMTTTGKLLGTARYLAPEQVSGGEVDARADLYATGIVLYEMLTRRVPFEAETDLATATLRLTEDPRPPSALRAGIPRALDDVVMRALARDPEDRFASAAEMRAALDRAAPGEATRPVQPPESAGAPRRGRRAQASSFRSWAAIPIALAVLAAAAVAVGLLWTRLAARDDPGPTASAPAAEPIAIRRALDHDPGGDGSEHPEDAPLAIDGDPETAWRTEGYETADLGGAKSGVGLVLDLGRVRAIRSLTISTTLPGWRFQLEGSDDGTSFLGPIRDRRDRRRFTADADGIRLRFPDAQFRYLLVWITDLVDDGEDYRATIAEVDVVGA